MERHARSLLEDELAAFGLDPDGVDAEVRIGARHVRLTNLRKPFWPADGISKGDLLRYYAAEARRLFAGSTTLPGPTGEKNTLTNLVMLRPIMT